MRAGLPDKRTDLDSENGGTSLNSIQRHWGKHMKAIESAVKVQTQ